MSDDPDLNSAYALSSVDDTKRLYAHWASTYDTDFAEAMDFLAPGHVADAFAAAAGTGPVLDFGAGTGVLGVHLKQHGIAPVDAVDLSSEMLEIARGKAVYRDLIAGNLLDGLRLDQRYSGVVSSGTFTHGHVGPDALRTLLAVAVPGAVLSLSINAEHYQSAGFAGAFDALQSAIEGLSMAEVRFYGPSATGPHKDDIGLITTFRKAPAG